MTDEDAFQAHLDANPEDHVTRLVFADWLQDHGDPRAEGYRALGALRRSPVRSGQHWFLGDNDAHFNSPEVKARYNPCLLPCEWLKGIAGGESGPGARPMRVEWARDLVRQCQSAGVACFVKQMGRSVVRMRRRSHTPHRTSEALRPHYSLCLSECRYWIPGRASPQQTRLDRRRRSGVTAHRGSACGG